MSSHTSHSDKRRQTRVPRYEARDPREALGLYRPLIAARSETAEAGSSRSRVLDLVRPIASEQESRSIESAPSYPGGAGRAPVAP